MSLNGAFREFTLEPRPVPKRIGLIALATDHTSERDFARLCDPDEVGVYVNRITYENPTTVENLRQTGPRLTAAAENLLPGEPLDVVAFGCTAASVVLGHDGVAGAIRQAKPEAACVTPVSGALEAFRALGVRRLSVLTPYTEAVTRELMEAFEEAGLELLNTAYLDLEDDREIARVSYQTIEEAGAAALHPEAEALFLSCTALRALPCVPQLEAAGGRPVVTSNQAVIWACLRACGLNHALPYGQLFNLPHPTFSA